MCFLIKDKINFFFEDSFRIYKQEKRIKKKIDFNLRVKTTSMYQLLKERLPTVIVNIINEFARGDEKHFKEKRQLIHFEIKFHGVQYRHNIYLYNKHGYIFATSGVSIDMDDFAPETLISFVGYWFKYIHYEKKDDDSSSIFDEDVYSSSSF